MKKTISIAIGLQFAFSGASFALKAVFGLLGLGVVLGPFTSVISYIPVVLIWLEFQQFGIKGEIIKLVVIVIVSIIVSISLQILLPFPYGLISTFPAVACVPFIFVRPWKYKDKST